MINTQGNFNGSNPNNNEKEMIEKIVARTGVTQEQAAQALSVSSGDLLDAIIYAERTYGAASKGAAPAAPQPEACTYTQSAAQSQSSSWSDFKNVLSKIWHFLIDNSVVISCKGKDYATVPVLVCAIATIASLSWSIVIAVGAMFFDVNYRFTGKELGTAKVNGAVNALYGCIQRLKRSFSAAK